jgi:hypothetical protein
LPTYKKERKIIVADNHVHARKAKKAAISIPSPAQQDALIMPYAHVP